MKHFKSLATFSKQVITDENNNTIKGVVIVQEGIDKNGGFFTKEFIDGLVEAGNNQSQGVKCRFGHPNMCKSSLGTFVGRFKNFSTINDGGVYKAIADLTLAEISKTTQVEGLGISYHDYIFQMTKENPDMFGNSIVFSSNCEFPETEIDGETFLVEKYLLPVNFIASDLVDSPAATDSLFKSSDDLGVMITSFLDDNPVIFDAIQKDESLIGNFLTRYEQYKNKKKNMNLIDKLLGKKQKDIEQTLGNGDVVTVITDAQEAKVGDKVNDSEGKPLSDDTYILPDGSKWVVVGGEITEIVPVEENPTEEPMQLSAQEKQTIAKMGEFMKSFDSKFETFTKDVNTKFEGVAKVVLEVQEKQTTLAKSIKSNYQSPKAEEKQVSQTVEKSFMDKVLEQKEAKQENK